LFSSRCSIVIDEVATNVRSTTRQERHYARITRSGGGPTPIRRNTGGDERAR
jgi:hypothetical protein